MSDYRQIRWTAENGQEYVRMWWIEKRPFNVGPEFSWPHEGELRGPIDRPVYPNHEVRHLAVVEESEEEADEDAMPAEIPPPTVVNREVPLDSPAITRPLRRRYDLAVANGWRARFVRSVGPKIVRGKVVSLEHHVISLRCARGADERVVICWFWKPEHTRTVKGETKVVPAGWALDKDIYDAPWHKAGVKACEEKLRSEP